MAAYFDSTNFTDKKSSALNQHWGYVAIVAKVFILIVSRFKLVGANICQKLSAKPAVTLIITCHVVQLLTAY